MIDIFKETLQDGMEIVKFKEMANVYKITLSYNGMIGTCDLSKMCAPKSEKSLCKQAINTAVSGMYINAGNLAEAKEWLDGNKWDLEDNDNLSEKNELFFNKDELLFIHEILGKIDYHLLMHILKDSDIRNREDLTMLMTRIYNRIDRELELDK